MEKISKLLLFLTIILAGFFTASVVLACYSHSYKSCSGNYLYWYDSCGEQQEIAEYCYNGCYNSSCNNYNNNNNYNNYNGYYYNNYPSCNNHAYRDCIGNSIYWYDSCGNQQEMYQNCQNYNLLCQFGQCVSNLEQSTRQTDYVAYSTKSCHNGSVYWYDSLGVISGLYKNCSDSNECTLDYCKDLVCLNTQKCDGTTCAVGSDSYNKYCLKSTCPNGTCEQNLGETNDNCPVDCKSNQEGQNTQNTEADAQKANLGVSFFAKKDLNSLQWDKTVQIGRNGVIYFMITINNNSNFQAENLIISVNIPAEISYLGNLKVDDVLVSGDIVSGINVGFVPAQGKKAITFEGKTQEFDIKQDKQAIAFLNSNQISQSDFISINFDASQSNLAAVSSQETKTNAIWEFFKRWYIWIISGLVLIFLFVIVFRRISGNV